MARRSAMSAVTKTIFRDLVKRNVAARHSLGTELAGLKARPRPTPEEEANIKRITELLALPEDEVVDPLFIGVRDSFNDDAASGLLQKTLLNHVEGVIKVSSEITDDDVVRVSLVHGILANGSIASPPLKVSDGEAVVVDTDPLYGPFTEAFYAALGRTRGAFTLARLVLPILQIEGDPDGRRSSPGEVDTAEFAAVIECLQSRGVKASESQL